MSQHPVNGLPEDVRLWCQEHFGTATDKVSQLTGGANNRVFLRETTNDRVVVKLYGPLRNGQPDRHTAETEFLTYANRVAPSHAPCLLKSNSQLRVIVMEYLDGSVFDSTYTPSQGDVNQAAEFLSLLNHDTSLARVQVHGHATDGFLSLKEHAANVDGRLADLRASHLPKKFQQTAETLVSSVNKEWQIAQQKLRYALDHQEVTDKLEAEHCCLSPSDFGFHNAIQSPDGLKFIDFEFAGWDDPTKTIVDFFLQPRIRVPEKYWKTMEQAVASSISIDILQHRARVLKMILHVKWLSIVLGILNPARLDAMLGVNENRSADALIQERLDRAGSLLSAGVPIGLP